MQKQTRIFTASEVAEFEYCALVWWHEQFEPWAQEESEALFARLVELEHEHNAQAPGLPEYRMIEQLLLRRGAFEEGRRQHQEHAEAVEDIEYAIDEEKSQGSYGLGRARLLVITIAILASLALLLFIFALLAR
jgi:hypothetical protein